MKLRRVFLGAAVVALMAACGGKTETTTETATPAEETQVATAPVEEAEAPVAKNDAKPATKANAKSDKAAPAAKVAKEDPCKAKVEKFVAFVDNLEAAQKNKANGAKAMKAFSDMLKQAPAEEAAVKDCLNEPAYKGTLQAKIMKAKQIRSTK